MKCNLFLISLLLLTGCTTGGSHNLITDTTDPVISTDVAGEYVIQARDLTPFTSNVKGAEENAIQGAIKHCNSLGQEFRKRYAITTPSAMRKWADATLHFRCVDKKSK